MLTLDTKRLKRNPELIKSYFKKVGESTVVKNNVRIIFPDRYINKELAVIGNSVKLVSIYAIIDEDDNYAVVSAPIYQEVSPNNINDISIDGIIYKELHFDKDDVFILNNNLVVTDNFMYDIFDEFFIKGNIPWFMDYNDMSNIMLETKKYAGSNIGKNPLTFEILTSIIARDKTNKKTYFRKILNKNNINKIKPIYVGLNNIYYSFDNTGARLIGGYFGAGLTTAMAEPETKSSEVSNILRS